jgi:hypothetical protein
MYHEKRRMFMTPVGQKIDPINFFPEEISVKIFSYMNTHIPSQVSRKWRRIANDEILWQNEFFLMLKQSSEITENQFDQFQQIYQAWENQNRHKPIAPVTIDKNEAELESDPSTPTKIALRVEDLLTHNEFKKLCYFEFHQLTRRFYKISTFIHLLDNTQENPITPERLKSLIACQNDLLNAKWKLDPLSFRYAIMHNFLKRYSISDIQIRNYFNENNGYTAYPSIH